MSEMPADIVRAIDEVVLAAGDHRRAANPLGPEFTAYEKARDALDAAILKHLAASAELEAEVTCLMTRADRAEAHSKELIWQDSEMCRMLEAENARLREACEQYEKGAAEVRSGFPGAARAHFEEARALAALAQPAAAEEELASEIRRDADERRQRLQSALRGPSKRYQK